MRDVLLTEASNVGETGLWTLRHRDSRVETSNRSPAPRRGFVHFQRKPSVMDRSSLDEIRRALDAARDIARNGALDRCDVADIEEIIAPVETELRAPRPNMQTLSTYLNSLAKSLRSDPGSRSVCMQIDSAMRKAGVPTHWEQ
jgi:hypothetical protein